MKKLLVLVALVVAINATAQVTVNMSVGSSYCEYNPVVSASGTSTNTVMYFNAAQNSPATQDFRVLLTKASGTFTNVTVSLYGTKFEDTWSEIGTTTWNAATATSVVTISNATDNRYRKYKVDVKTNGTAPVLYLSGFKFKLYY